MYLHGNREKTAQSFALDKFRMICLRVAVFEDQSFRPRKYQWMQILCKWLNSSLLVAGIACIPAGWCTLALMETCSGLPGDRWSWLHWTTKLDSYVTHLNHLNILSLQQLIYCQKVEDIDCLEQVLNSCSEWDLISQELINSATDGDVVGCHGLKVDTLTLLLWCLLLWTLLVSWCWHWVLMFTLAMCLPELLSNNV